MIAAITGIGWVNTEGMGWGGRHEPNTSGDGTLPKVTSRMIFGTRLPHFGRLDTYSKIGIAAIAFALKDAQRFEWTEKRPMGIFASTTHGCLEADISYLETMLPNGRLASPSLFAYVLPNIFLGEAAIRFGFTGPCYCINEDEPYGLNSLRTALNSLLLDELPAAVAGICDGAHTSSLEGLDEVKPGAAFFVLERSPENGRLSYGDIEMDDEGNITFDGETVTGLWELLEQCLGTRKSCEGKTMDISVSITGVGWVGTESMGWGHEYEENSGGEGVLPKVSSKTALGKGVRQFGMLDTYSKIGIAAIAFALRDAGRFEWNEKRAIGIIASTKWGCLERDMEYIETMVQQGGRFASPGIFAFTLPNVFIGQAAIYLGLTGPCYCVNEDDPSGLNGLRMALRKILLDESSAIIAGVCDAGRPASFAGADETRPGAVFFVLDRAPRDKEFSYGRLVMDEDSTLFFDGKKVADIRGLMHMCTDLVGGSQN